MWNFLLWLFAALSLDSHAARVEPIKCRAAVAAAYAAIAPPLPDIAPPDDSPAPAPKCCGECGGTGFVTMPDGHRIPCSCGPDCECKKQAVQPAKQSQDANCKDGKCSTTIIYRRR